MRHNKYVQDYKPSEDPQYQSFPAGMGGGRTAKGLFLFGAFLILVTLPIVSSSLSLSVFVALIAILGIEFAASFTAPRQKWIAIANAVIAMVAVVVFEYITVAASLSAANSTVFWVNQILAINFFFAFYYSCKTLRRIYFE